MKRLAISLTLAFAPSAARAWDVQGAQIANRVADLEQAWIHKGSKELLADKLKRALQPRRPDWVNKSSWFARLGDKVYRFGVGLTEEMRYKDLQLAIAENRALALVLARNQSASVIDWYWDKEEETLYALAVEIP